VVADRPTVVHSRFISRPGRLYFIPPFYSSSHTFWNTSLQLSSASTIAQGALRSFIIDCVDLRRCPSCRSSSATGGTTLIVPFRGSSINTLVPAFIETTWSQASAVSASTGRPCARSSGTHTTDHGGTWRVRTRADPARFSWRRTISRFVSPRRECRDMVNVKYNGNVSLAN